MNSVHTHQSNIVQLTLYDLATSRRRFRADTIRHTNISLFSLSGLALFQFLVSHPSRVLGLDTLTGDRRVVRCEQLVLFENRKLSVLSA